MPITIITKTIQKVLKLRRLRSKKDKKKKFLTPGGRWKINEYFATIRKCQHRKQFCKDRHDKKYISYRYMSKRERILDMKID